MASQQVRVNKPIRDSFRSGMPVSLLYWNTQFYLNLKMLLNEISYSEYLCKDMHTDFILLPYLFFDSKLVCPIVLFSLYVHYLSYFQGSMTVEKHRPVCKTTDNFQLLDSLTTAILDFRFHLHMDQYIS